jgi:hypothetical protein
LRVTCWTAEKVAFVTVKEKQGRFRQRKYLVGLAEHGERNKKFQKEKKNWPKNRGMKIE